MLLDGFGSSSLLDDQTGKSDPNNHGVRDRFAAVVQRLTEADPATRVIYFSYRLGQLLADGREPERAWTGRRFESGREPAHRSTNVTDRPLHDHIAALDWIVAKLRDQNPDAKVDLVGHSLGAVVALAWVADRMTASDEAQAKRLEAIRRVVSVNGPLGGLHPAVTSAPELRRELSWRNLELGTAKVLTELATSPEFVARLKEAADRVAAESIECRGDYLVNGERVLGLGTRFDASGLGVWLGRGAARIVAEPRLHAVDLEAGPGDLLRAHRLILESDDPGASEARDRLAELLAP